MSEFSKSVFEHYEAHYTRNADEYFQPLAEVVEFHLDRLPRWLPRIDKQARILDAGCATGYQLKLLHEAGYTNLTGIDISRELTAIARSKLPDSVPIQQTDVFEFLAASPEAAYDAILFHHVIEHIPRERCVELLQLFNRCLSKGGYLSIRTPNAACLLGGYHGFGDITHVVQLNERSLLQVLEQAGFDPALVDFIAHKPLLFWSWGHPLKATYRLLNRLRWHINRAIHKVVCILLEIRPAPKVSDWELDALVHKPQ
jgi:2-polyprenyl-3-methyl-5-hydroxy-6-metoxy-1,4-benzoquinol methylase